VPGPAFCTGALSVCGGRDVLIGGRMGGRNDMRGMVRSSSTGGSVPAFS
jgi:hypothetical protein